MIQNKAFFAENELRNFSYLIFNDQTGDAWIIDPYDATILIQGIKKLGLNLKGILNTHHHWDHTRGNNELSEYFSAEVVSVKAPGKVELDQNCALEFLLTPGHTLDHTAFLLHTHSQVNALFSGDTLFNSGVGNCRQGGDVHQLYETTQKLSILPDEVVLYPGHDYLERNLAFAIELEPSNLDLQSSLAYIKEHAKKKYLPWTLGQEKKVNPFFRLNSEELKLNLAKKLNRIHFKDEKDIFIQLRALRDQW